MDEVFIRAILATAAAGAVSGIGAVTVVFVREVPSRIYSTLLGFSAGVMLGMATLVLLPEALSGGSPIAALIGLASGAAFVMFMEMVLPHFEPHFGSDQFNPGFHNALLLAVAIAIHNIPEGLALGLGYVTEAETIGPKLAVSVAVQNIPEGLAIALPLKRAGVSSYKYVLFATASGLSEVLGAAAGVLGVGLIEPLLPFGLAFASGALIYVVADQLIPEARDSDRGFLPPWGTTVGIMVILVLGWFFGVDL